MDILKDKRILLLIIAIILIAILGTTYQAFGAKKSSGPIEVEFAAKDGFNLVAKLDIPKGKSLNNKAPLVLLLHSLGKSSVDWYDYPSKIKELDVAVMTLDLRGHGKSIKDKKMKRKYWQNFSSKVFQKYPDDILTAIDYVRQQYPEVDTNRVAIIASNVSANASVVMASKNNRMVKTLVLLSPTAQYKGIETRIPMVNYGKQPVLVMVSRKDRFFYNGSVELLKYAQGKKELKAYPSGGNGMDILRFQPDSKQYIINWLKTNFLDKK